MFAICLACVVINIANRKKEGKPPQFFRRPRARALAEITLWNILLKCEANKPEA